MVHFIGKRIQIKYLAYMQTKCFEYELFLFLVINNNRAFQNEDGTEAEQKGYLKNAGTENEIQVKEGSYTYIDTDGKLVKVKYIADENVRLFIINPNSYF